MNVLHINQSDIFGGAAIAAYRLHQGLQLQGVNSRLLVGGTGTDSDRVASVPRKYRIENLLHRFTQRTGLNYLHLIGSFDIIKHHFYQEANVINFHNLHTGYFSYLAIPKLTKNKPAIFTLHDMWSFTGHCAYSYDCDRWQTGCGQCPYPDIYPTIDQDNTYLEWKLKDWLYSRSNLTIVTPSLWLKEQAEKSLLNRFSIHYIPNGIDTNAYQPLDPKQCRALLDIPADKNVLMFGAEKLRDTRKGGHLLLAALERLPNSLKSTTQLIILGNGGETIEEAVGIPSLNLGFVASDRLKSIAYSAADLFIFPTRADNLPLVLQESMACGTPMVSFKVGGVSELVRPGATGYLATPEDANDFCNGIIQLLEDRTLREWMSQQCREIVLKEYSLELQVQRYLEVYSQAINRTII